MKNVVTTTHRCSARRGLSPLVAAHVGLLLLFALGSTPEVAHAQICSGSEGAFTVDLLSMTEVTTYLYQWRLTNDSRHELKEVLFELPDGVVPASPVHHSTYMAPSGRSYKVDNPVKNARPFHAIKFKREKSKPKGPKGPKNGEYDIFEFSLPDGVTWDGPVQVEAKAARDSSTFTCGSADLEMSTGFIELLNLTAYEEGFSYISPLLVDDIAQFTVVVQNMPRGPFSVPAHSVEITFILPVGMDALSVHADGCGEQDTIFYPSSTEVVLSITELRVGVQKTLCFQAEWTICSVATNAFLASVTSSDRPDPDSSPGPVNFPIPEDDEAQLIRGSLTGTDARNSRIPRRDASTPDAPLALDGTFELSAESPASFSLDANYPNPFNPETVIPFALPEAAHVSLTVYDVLGRQVAVLHEGALPAGRHEVRWRADGWPTGVYLVRMVAPGTVKVRQLTLTK